VQYIHLYKHFADGLTI